MTYANAKWLDGERTRISVTYEGTPIEINAIPGLMHYDAIVASGMSIAPYVPPPLTESDYGAAVQAHVEATARARGYHDAATCASYIGSTIPPWQADAEAFVAWRDAVWLYVYAQLAAVQAEQRAQPSIEELIAELPAIVWPASD